MRRDDRRKGERALSEDIGEERIENDEDVRWLFPEWSISQLADRLLSQLTT